MKTIESHLNHKKCNPSTDETRPLNHIEQNSLLQELSENWRIERGHHLEKEYHFPDFRQALWFTNCISELAESEGHHPDIYLSWGRVKVFIWTHKIDGLSENDFILAAKCDQKNDRLQAERPCF